MKVINTIIKNNLMTKSTQISLSKASMFYRFVFTGSVFTRLMYCQAASAASISIRVKAVIKIPINDGDFYN